MGGAGGGVLTMACTANVCLFWGDGPHNCASQFGGFHPGFVPGGPSAADPCQQCGHKCAAAETASGTAVDDEGVIAAFVASWLASAHLPSLQERFARFLRDCDFEVRRRGAV